MEVKYDKDIIIKIIPSENLIWTKDLFRNECIPWTYLEKRYTKFQVNVWKEIVKVNWGDTATYKDIAIAIGSPNSYRAVANACGVNPLPLLIPCHRIVSKFNLGGYFYGISLKKYLIETEK